MLSTFLVSNLNPIDLGYESDSESRSPGFAAFILVSAAPTCVAKVALVSAVE